MEISAAFHISVFLLTVLVFSRTFATFARRNAGQVDPEMTAAQDEDAAHLEVKVEAEQNAHRDINKFLWLGTGIGILCLASFMGISGCLVGSIIVPAEDSLGFMPMIDFSGWAIVIGCIGFISGVLIPFVGIHRGGVNLPPEQLLEKSPKHVEFYTNAYRSKTRSLRLRWAIIGIGVVIGGLSLLGLVSSL
ncbi:MAG: hypothetical protein OYL97_10845 [Candidatus Poribacteria bacterium]|nr:hypothetical protein [Candidatus Poribacteria bacterium]